MKGLALRQAAALVWLRVTLSKRALSDGGMARILLAIVGVLVGGGLSVLLAGLIWDAAGPLAHDGDELRRRGGPLAVFATWLSMALVGRLWFSIRSLGGSGPFLDPRRFLPMAVPARVVSGINYLAALLEPTWLFFYVPLVGIALGVARLPGAPPAWALLSAELTTIFAVAGLLHLFGALGSALGARPGIQRALLVLLGFAGFAAFQLSAARPGRLGIATLFAERRWQVIAATPPGWAAVLARALADSSLLHAFTPVLLLAGLGGGATLLAHRLSLREAQRPEQAAAVRTTRRPRAGWQLPFGHPIFSALIEKELKTLLRTGWLQLVVVPAGFLLLRTAFVGSKPGTFGGEPLLVAAAYAHLGVLDVATNAFGRDHGAARGWFLWPVDRRLLFAAKNASAYLFSLGTFALLCGVQAFAGTLTPSNLAVGLLAHAATFPLLAALGNVTSVRWPTPVRRVLMRQVRGAGPIGARLVAVAVLVCAAWAPFGLALLLRLPVLVAYAGALVVSAVAYGGLLAMSVSLLDSRKEAMLHALAKDE